MPDHPVPPALTPDHIELLRIVADDHLLQTWKVRREIRGYVGLEIGRVADFLAGFTPEDVQLLQSVAAHWDRYCDGDEAKEISALASRISSLLPPPPTNTGAITLRVSETRADDIKVCAVCGGADSHRPGCRFASSSPPPTT